MDELNIWLNHLNDREYSDLINDGASIEINWTEEVIVPKDIYEKFSEGEKLKWKFCDLCEIYSSKDIVDIYNVKPTELNDCFSRKFYKLTTNELKKFESLYYLTNKNLPINEVLILYSQ